jgi:HK97 family phage prohead protease
MLWGGVATGGGLELRRENDGSVRLRGRFPYNEPAILSDGGRSGRPRKEVMASNAFEYRVNRPDEDIHLLVGHDYDHPLASRGTGTLNLRDTAAALMFEANVRRAIAETTHGKDALAMIGAGLAVGISPGFRIPPERAVPDAEEVVEEDPAEGMALIRVVKSALLFELSVVTRPAYPKAQIEARSWRPASLPRIRGLSHPLKRWRL